jgi:hypothetical protein
MARRGNGSEITSVSGQRIDIHFPAAGNEEFGPLRRRLSAGHFPDDEAVEMEVTAWFRQQPKEFYAAGFQGLVKQWDKCLSVQGDYVEK